MSTLFSLCTTTGVKRLQQPSPKSSQSLLPILTSMVGIFLINSVLISASYERPCGKVWVVLICALLIPHVNAQAYLVSEELLQAEVSESLGKLKISLELCHMFRKTYEERRANLSQYQRNGNTVPPWDFSPQLVFSRLDLFTQRLVMVKEVLETVVDLFKLEKLEIGGVKGHILSQHVQILHQNFVEVYKNFVNKSSACLDLTNKDFDADVSTFQLLVEDTDRRLGAIFCQAFDSNPGLEHAFKVVDLFGSLCERSLVAADAVSRYPILLSMFDQELDNTRVLYRRHIQAADQRAWTPVNKNMPAVAGGLRWVHELKRRIQSLFSMFTQLSYPCLESAAGAQVIHKYEDTMQLLDRYASSLYDSWAQTVAQTSECNLSLPLITREPTSRLLSVNFNPQLVSVLREVKYLTCGQSEALPEAALLLYSRREHLWQYVSNLELTVHHYNKMTQSVLEVELPLVQAQLQNLDSELNKAQEVLQWNSEDIWPYILEVRDHVCELEARLQKSKENIEDIQRITRGWASPVFERREGKRDALLRLDEQTDKLENFYNMIRASGEKILFLLKSSLQLLGADESSEEWKAYLDYIDDMIMDGFFHSIRDSLQFLLDNTDQKSTAPLMEVLLDLNVPDLIFSPSLDYGTGDGLLDRVEVLIRNLFRMSSLVPRVAKHCGIPHYQVRHGENT
uniref:Dynein heavy chain tail domain-containing protein n=1 Tax=Knipowitschia caucasica TaxID=637954 RepID=A0AAV2JZN7_KNICA